MTGSVFTPSSISLLLVLSTAVWWLFLDPLRRIPGPWYARLSSLWLTKQSRLGRRAQAVHELHLRYGDVVRIASGHVSINDADALHEIFGHDRQFPKGPWYNTFKSGDPMTNNIVSLDSVEVHRDMRKDMSPAFSARALREFEPRMSKYHQLFKESLLNQLKGMKDEEVEVDMNLWTNLLAFDIIADFSFGKPFGFLEKGRDDEGLMWALAKRGTVANALGVLPTWVRPYMHLIPFDSFWKASAASIARIKKLSEYATNERLEKNDPETKDLLSYMLNAKSERGESWSRTRIFNQATQTVIAGSDSTSASTVYLTDFISRNGEVQQRIQAEIDELFPGQPDPDWVPMDSDTTSLAYTRAVLYEVLRLVPTAASGFERVVTQPETRLAGYEIPVGTLVSVPTWTFHRTAKVFADPETFDPERWLGDSVAEQQKNWNIFSTGPRNCIGKTFAMMEMMKTITLVFKLFDVERVGNHRTEYEEGFFLKSTECRVRLRKRH